MTASKRHSLQYEVSPGTKIDVNLEVRLKSVLVEESGAPSDMGNMELHVLMTSASRDVPRPCSMLFNGPWGARCWSRVPTQDTQAGLLK